MTTLEMLLSKRWIVKEENKELYYKIKDDIGPIKKFVTEKLGYPIIMNQALIKLEKVPAKPEAWMGIEEFDDKMEYALLCVVLMFLEDKDAREQFVLSQLTEYIQLTFKYEEIDWTNYNTRRKLIHVMKFCLQSGMIRVNDGNEENFAYDYEGDVLYENTGISRYFMKNFTQNIENYTKAEDFLNSEWIGMDEDRGIIRRQRVYRNLLMSMGLYRTTDTEEDYVYVRNYRNMIREELENYFECDLQVHKSSAYLILGENCSLGKTFPSGNTLSDIILLCNSILMERIEKKQVEVLADERIVMDDISFQNILQECKTRFGNGWVKKYREKTSGEFIKEVEQYLEKLEWIQIDKGVHQVTIQPIMGKIMGQYPKDFTAGGTMDE